MSVKYIQRLLLLGEKKYRRLFNTRQKNLYILLNSLKFTYRAINRELKGFKRKEEIYFNSLAF